MKATTKLKEAKEICKPLRNLWLPKEVKQTLDSGRVMFAFHDGDGLYCWPYFPIGKHRDIVKQLESEGVVVPKEIKVIVEIDATNDVFVKKYIFDCFGHVLLYLSDPKASNECDDAVRFANQLGIYSQA